MFIAVFVRRLRPGKTYDDFIDAWYPDKGFGVPARVTTATNVDDEREVLTIGVMDADLSPEALQAVAPQEAVRHNRLDDVNRVDDAPRLLRPRSRVRFLDRRDRCQRAPLTRI